MPSRLAERVSSSGSLSIPRSTPPAPAQKQQISSRRDDYPCTVHLDDDEEEEYQLEVDDVVSIEEGNLYYDTPGAPGGSNPAPATGGGSGTPPGKG